jgi:hypothetical protein
MDGRCVSQNELAQRWQVSESTLERWRSQRTGPMLLRLGGQVRYRVTDIEAFETRALGTSSSNPTRSRLANGSEFMFRAYDENLRLVHQFLNEKVLRIFLF